MQLTLPLDQTQPAPPQGQPLAAIPAPGRLIGSWCGGERLVVHRHEAGLVPAHVWFHFFDDTSAAVTIRYREEQHPLVATGSWLLDEESLVLRLGRSEVRDRPRLEQGLLRWAGEVLVRVPEGLPPYPALRLRA